MNRSKLRPDAPSDTQASSLRAGTHPHTPRHEIGAEPPSDCARCPRLAAFRASNREAFPDWFNAPVPSFGGRDSRLLVVGLAPGLKGANRTGRPFTGDFAGDLLYETLIDFGFARGSYAADPEDGLELVDCMITNAVRCVPPQNKPTPAEANTCVEFLARRIEAQTRLEIILALGRIAHDAVLKALDARRAAYPFAHGAVHTPAPGLVLIDSFHCSRYNTNTGRLTRSMFRDVFAAIAKSLSEHRKALSAPSSRRD
ncbi:MAG: uracil-DNA glycosylase [Hyphomicrobiaceae bacterium]|nr:uracil-DNA glycosylase [Hyphomicrobiaceae bacterium]